MTRNNSLFKHVVILAVIFGFWGNWIEGHCDLLIDDRNECGYPGIERVECEDRNCCWIPFSQDDLRNPPWCSKPASDSCGYSLIPGNENLLQDRCNSSRTANITIEMIDANILSVKIIRTKGEFQVPSSIYPILNYSTSINEKLLDYKTYEDQNNNFNFKIYRTDTNETIWETDLLNQASSSSIQMKSFYTQIGSKLPLDHSIFGLGYHAGKLKVEPGTRIALFARDLPTIEGQNLYSAHPFYLQLQNGKAHGVVINMDSVACVMLYLFLF